MREFFIKFVSVDERIIPKQISIKYVGCLRRSYQAINFRSV
jgi:hypothetical protein